MAHLRPGAVPRPRLSFADRNGRTCLMPPGRGLRRTPPAAHGDEDYAGLRCCGLDGHMRPNRSIPSATVIPVLSYPDVREAVAWLTASFGFAERVRVGEDHRAQMSVGDAAVIVADTEGRRRAPDPAVTTCSVTVRVADVQSQRARAAEQGAAIVMEPTDFPFGERQCTVQDPWGHHWTFSQTISDVAPEDWGGKTVNAW